jgi:hypothetical protein
LSVGVEVGVGLLDMRGFLASGVLLLKSNKEYVLTS